MSDPLPFPSSYLSHRKWNNSYHSGPLPSPELCARRPSPSHSPCLPARQVFQLRVQAPADDDNSALVTVGGDALKSLLLELLVRLDPLPTEKLTRESVVVVTEERGKDDTRGGGAVSASFSAGPRRRAGEGTSRRASSSKGSSQAPKVLPPLVARVSTEPRRDPVSSPVLLALCISRMKMGGGGEGGRVGCVKATAWPGQREGTVGLRPGLPTRRATRLTTEGNHRPPSDGASEALNEETDTHAADDLGLDGPEELPMSFGKFIERVRVPMIALLRGRQRVDRERVGLSWERSGKRDTFRHGGRMSKVRDERRSEAKNTCFR